MKFRNYEFCLFIKTALFLLIFYIPSLSAQYDRLKFRHINSDNGLSQNFVASILQDKMGYMWFGTKDGLNRYDGYTFKVYRHNPFDSTTVSGNFINAIFEDSKGRLWIGSNSLDLFIPESDNFRRIELNPVNKKDTAEHRSQITCFTEDKNGRIWIGTNFGLIYYDADENISWKYSFGNDLTTPLDDNFILSLSADDSLLIAGTQNGMKLIRFDSLESNSFEVINISHIGANDLLTSRRTILSQFRVSSEIIYAGTPSGLIKVNLVTKKSEFIPYTGQTFTPFWHNRILSIIQDKNSNLWLGCSGGLVIYNPARNNFIYHFHNPKDPRSLSMNSIIYLYSDRSGKIWIGTAGKGINLFDQNRKDFSLYEGLIDKEPFKTNFSISAILSDSKNQLWISSQHKLFKLNRTTGEYIRVNLLYGPEGEITSIKEDKKQNIWVSSSGGIYRISGSGEISYFNHNPSRPNSLKNDFVRLLFTDNNENLFALNSGYLSKFNAETNSFTHYKLNLPEDKNREVIIKSIVQTRDGSLWLGSSNGLVKYNLDSNEKVVYTHQPGNDKNISNNDILTICEDPVQPKKYLWAGTQGGGLSRLNLEDDTFTNFTVSNGLPNNVIYGILPSGNQLWLSTNNGLCRVTIDKYGIPSFRNYDVSDGLQGNEFNTGAYFKSHTDELFFGGLNGVNAFFPSRIRDNVYIPPVAITELRFLKNIDSEGKDFKTQINMIKNDSQIKIPYSQNSFTIQFAALDYTAPEKNRYIYKLKPAQEEWISLGTRRSVTFSELGPGEYTLTVRGSNNDGIWNEEGASLNLIITPPLWRTWWAYSIYFIVFLSVLFVLRKYEMNRLRLKNRLKQEYFETQKLKELDEMKSGFFANISHEFRTPLTLIIGPGEQLENEETNPAKKEMLAIIRKNAARLLRLINQILDLSRLEKGKLKLNCAEGNIVDFLQGIIMSFSLAAERRKIQVKYIPGSNYIPLYFDKDVIEKIFYNLLSNAFKFTPASGIIEVAIDGSVTENNIKYCRVSVKDSGIGISEDDLKKVFTKFYQVSQSSGYTDQGSGIGLALVKELVEFHYGKIKVESKLNEGTTFDVLLPLGKDHLKAEDLDRGIPAVTNYPVVVPDVESSTEKQIIPDNTSPEKDDDSLIVLIVEDNNDIRKYISDYLKDNYKIVEAADGRKGFDKAAESVPDLIISDIMMPEMNGYDLCKRLKTDERTSHIPVILLTAKAGEEDKMEGLETGADDYLTKPFNSRELSIRVKNLIELRQKLRKKFSGSLVIKPKEVAANSIDKLFIEKALKVVEHNIKNENFTVLDFGKEMNLSHSQLHRKLKALLNQSANQFIRSVKMQRALQLLKSKAGTIAEIGYQVGYNDPGYFTKTFSNHFGYLPSEVNGNK
jgi:signal transduction histidine kinase/ligand-binding sensor domain-containing protein/DNA-binding response OmpR family regulator